MLEPLIEELTAAFGEDDPMVLRAQGNLANALVALGDRPGAMALRKIIDTRLRRFWAG